MPVPGGTSSAPRGASSGRMLTRRDMDRLADVWLELPYRKMRERPAGVRSFLRGMTLAFRPRRAVKPTFIRDDALAIALDWHMVGKDMRKVMGDFEGEVKAVRAGDRPRP